MAGERGVMECSGLVEENSRIWGDHPAWTVRCQGRNTDGPVSKYGDSGWRRGIVG